MKIETLNRGDAQKAMEEWIMEYPSLPVVKDEYNSIREEIQRLNKKVRQEMSNNTGVKKPEYYIDAHFGLELYEYLWNIPDFSMRIASNDGFWRYLSVKVVPDVVTQRWGKDNHSHFWSMPTRIWLCSIWWYVHLAWQGDYDSTRKILECSYFSTDTILNFVERTGKKGICIDAYRWILYYYSKVPEEEMQKYVKKNSCSFDDLFRVVMKLNTAKMMVIEPALCLGKEKAYARELFEDAGVSFDVP